MERLVIARAAGPWQSSSFQPARRAADAAALVLEPDSVFLAPSQTFLASSQIDLAPSQTFLASSQIDLAPSQTFLALGQIDLAPSQTFLALGQIDLAPSQTFLASSQIPPAPSQIDPVWHPPCSLEEFPSPACGGGWPKAGRGLPTIRRAATLIKKGAKEKNACPLPAAKENSVDALRMEQSPLSALWATLSRQAGEGNPSEELVIAKALPLSPFRHCEARSAVAIQFVSSGAQRRRLYAVFRTCTANADFEGVRVSPEPKSANDDLWIARNYLQRGRRVRKWFD
ncbi:MAG: hypothetical protein LBF50_11135 [Azoarcus sp.]|nr:hypothetical protein [Azoarcus sp.]